MIILDTHVISGSLRPRCSDAVTAWLDAQAAESLYLTAINAAELWAGVAVMPEDTRKAALEASLDDLLARLFGARRLDFDHVPLDPMQNSHAGRRQPVHRCRWRMD